ncbi:MAG: hypothetical protein K0S79_113 [Nitrospira sp.]|nr:hypothetical protein [Nitrospira sp.]
MKHAMTPDERVHFLAGRINKSIIARMKRKRQRHAATPEERISLDALIRRAIALTSPEAKKPLDEAAGGA